MSRVKLTEYKAKSLLFKELNLPYDGLSVSTLESSSIKKLSKDKLYVVKVDQGVKKRMKKGLVRLNVSYDVINAAIKDLSKKGFNRFIIEEMVTYNQSNERYIALERTREGIVITYSKKGGIDIEDNASEVKRIALPYNSEVEKQTKEIAKELGIEVLVLIRMREFFEKYYVSFMEINPLVVENGKVHILDLAAEVDSTAQFVMKDAWKEQDIVGDTYHSEEEQRIQELNKKSTAAFSLSLLNPHGSIWVLLSGGGASVTIADEVYNLGFGKELGNYGEYSGNPNTEETYLYTKAVLDLMMKSDRRRLILLIGGGVANFTDIRVTFNGIIKALEEYKLKLKKKQIKVFVRRGGPFQKEGLTAIEEWLKVNNMFGLVEGPTLPLHDIVQLGIKELKKK